MILSCLYIFFIKTFLISTTLEKVVIGIVGAGLIITFLAIRDSGIVSKKGRERNLTKKKINQVERDLDELDNLYGQGILNNNERIEKSIDLQKKRIDLIVDQKLIDNDDFNAIVNAHKNGYLTDSQKNDKIEVIRNQLKRNLD